MYQTVLSPASARLDTMTLEPGLTPQSRIDPVLCCPAVLTLVGSVVMGAVVASALQNATGNAADDTANGVDPGASTECTEVAGNFATSALYLPPGRLSLPAVQVPEGASVDQLISAARGR